MKEREISLLDLIFAILLRWRGILVSMLIGVVLLGGFSYMNSYRAHKAQVAKVEAAKQQLEEETAEGNGQVISEEQAEILAGKLTDLQRYNVNYVITYEQLYQDKLAYMEESVTMMMDPKHVQWGEATLLVTSDDLERSYNIVALYEDLVRSGELFERIAEELEITTVALNEMISLEKEENSISEGSDILRVRVSHYDEELCAQVMQKVLEYLEQKQAEVAKYMGKHKVVLMSQSQVAVSDENVLSEQKSYRADLISMENSIATYKSKFKDEEWQYYDFLVHGKLTGLNADAPASPKDIINAGVTVYPGFSLKYMILGAILGAFVYVFIVFVMYILNGKIRATDNLQALYDIPQLGAVLKAGKSKRFLGFVDDWIIAVRDLNKRKFTGEEAVELASVAVKMAAGKLSLDTVYLIGCDLKDEAKAVCEQMKSKLEKEEMNVQILNNVLYDARVLGDLEHAQGVVLVEKVGSTLYTEIARELDLLNRQDIAVLGGIVVE